jgi:hypothetical protein
MEYGTAINMPNEVKKHFVPVKTGKFTIPEYIYRLMSVPETVSLIPTLLFT